MSKSARPICVAFKLADVTTREQLARALGVPPSTFSLVIKCTNPQLLYRRHEIAKKNPRRQGEVRVVWESRDEHVARAHKAIARRLDIFARQQQVGYPHKAVHGYVRGGSTRSNAEQHCGARLLLRADIEDFFPTITESRIVRILRSLGMHTRPAKALARFATIEGRLPLGLPESPVLSNLICVELDQDFQATADNLRLHYTRYADDITLSGYGNLPSREEVRATLAHHDFRLADRKFRISKRGQSHYVTGLSVSERQTPHAPKKAKHKLRQELYYCEKFGLADHAQKIGELERATFNRLAGTVSYMAFIERRQAVALCNQWGRIAAESGRETSFASVPNMPHRSIYAVVDEAQFEHNGLKYLAVCVARTEQPQLINMLLGGLKTSYQTTPGAKGDLAVLDKVGIHYSDAHPDLRTKTLDLLTKLRWSASIYFGVFATDGEYKATYIRLIRDAIRQELIAADGCTLSIDVEQNAKVRSSELKSVLDANYAEAERRGNRRPVDKPLTNVIGKLDTACLTIPDFVLATFRHFVLPTQYEHPLEFEHIRDNVRYVQNADNGYFYTRKRPFIEIGRK